MNVDAKTVLREVQGRLAMLYGERLRGVYLYGSYARGDYDAESDFDVLAVLDDFASYAEEVDRAAELTAALSLQYGVSISEVFVREQEWRTGDSPFLRNVREEAVAA